MGDPVFDWYFENVVVGGQPRTLPPLHRRRLRRRARWHDAADAAAAVPGTDHAVALARTQGLVLTCEQARSCGLSGADIRRLVRRGTWTAPRRGVLCVVPRSDDPEHDVHGLAPQILATAVALVRPDVVVSHQSAAAIDEIELLTAAKRPVFTALEANGGGQPDVLVHHARLRRTDQQRWFGTSLTRPARTVVDLARNEGLRFGLVAADSALATGLCTKADLAATLRTATRWPGVRTARRVVELADPGGESALESLTRLLMVTNGLPAPVLQALIPTDRGVYRVDGLWPRRRVIIECDGLDKYEKKGSLRAEKLRQEALERAGYRVVRVTWDDIVRHPAETLARIRAALVQGGR